MDREALKLARELSDHLVILSSTFDLAPQELKAMHFRRCEKSLLFLERSFTPELAQEAAAWNESYNALMFLIDRKQHIENLEKTRSRLQESMSQLNTKLINWTVASKEVQGQILLFGSKANEIIANNDILKESASIGRYSRYCSLKPLLQFLENKNYLCDALIHYQKLDSYETRIKELQGKIQTSLEREKTVQRGFFLALAMCLFVITVPFCFPFVYSLWGRRKEILEQITEYKEEERIQRRCLEMALEGAAAHDNVVQVVGNETPPNQLRLILMELEELHKEFQCPLDRAQGLTQIFCFLEKSKFELEKVCGPFPSQPEDLIYWLNDKTNEIINLQLEIESTEHSLHKTVENLHRLLRGHGKGILLESIEKLMHEVNTNQPMNFFSRELSKEIADICELLPRLLFSARELIGYFTQGYLITEKQWFSIRPHLHSVANRFGTCVVFSEALANHGVESAQRA